MHPEETFIYKLAQKEHQYIDQELTGRSYHSKGTRKSTIDHIPIPCQARKGSPKRCMLRSNMLHRKIWGPNDNCYILNISH
jgi:hypothetical protein